MVQGSIMKSLLKSRGMAIRFAIWAKLFIMGPIYGSVFDGGESKGGFTPII